MIVVMTLFGGYLNLKTDTLYLHRDRFQSIREMIVQETKIFRKK
jgi:hypothetical protein